MSGQLILGYCGALLQRDRDEHPMWGWLQNSAKSVRQNPAKPCWEMTRWNYLAVCGVPSSLRGKSLILSMVQYG